jgi:hypothetical protein
MTTCGHCGGRGWVLRASYDMEGRARPEGERRVACEYCAGAGACSQGHMLLPASETAPADPDDVARAGLPAWA